MKKTVIIFCYIICYSFNISYAQIGIFTETPFGIFNIDAGSDNVETANTNRFNNDIVITNDGAIVIGNTTPATNTRLDINGTFRLNDNYQMPDKVLVTKDVAGTANWAIEPYPQLYIEPELSSILSPFRVTNSRKYSGVNITVPGGAYEITFVTAFKNPVIGKIANIECDLSESSTAFGSLGQVCSSASISTTNAITYATIAAVYAVPYSTTARTFYIWLRAVGDLSSSDYLEYDVSNTESYIWAVAVGGN
ncbi:hypothetical protein [Dysgonomonas macrotermitis]|uniref:Uncharacterized protein n=1 Tax=Dysgonomonas macrotermitis TaxID=1346286 RepID=A0A1M4ZS67_9BACT|nr:hypothetical protein [Dysgonomonas macrotermitis]SHF20913.1 hypothetical protein SAMN05444362_104174 [Dysgonomonas macrotermitis]